MPPSIFGVQVKLIASAATDKLVAMGTVNGLENEDSWPDINTQHLTLQAGSVKKTLGLEEGGRGRSDGDYGGGWGGCLPNKNESMKGSQDSTGDVPLNNSILEHCCTLKSKEEEEAEIKSSGWEGVMHSGARDDVIYRSTKRSRD